MTLACLMSAAVSIAATGCRSESGSSERLPQGSPGTSGTSDGTAPVDSATGEAPMAGESAPTAPDTTTAIASSAAPVATVRASTAPVATAPTSTLRFEDVTAAVGMDFRHHAGYTPERYAPETMSGGLVMTDVDRDGDPDLLLIDSGVLVGEASADTGPRLYINDGAGGLSDATAAWGLNALAGGAAGYGTGAAAGDVDGDGLVDLFLATYGRGERLLRNTGTGFQDITANSGIEDDGQWTTSSAFLDIEGDGDLDLWQVRYTDYDVETAVRCYHSRVHVHCGPDFNFGVPDRLYANDGTGRFEDISEAAGLSAQPPGKGLALVTGDIDLDGDVDVYVANDQTRNHLWLNDGSGRFTEEGRLAAVAYSNQGAEEAGMGADMSDLDGDGRLDLLVPNFQRESVSLYLQTMPLFFREESDALGIGMTARARLGFGVEAFDADNDGDEDVYVANGHLNDNAAELGTGLTFAQPDTLYENHDGRFTDVTAAAGPGIAEPGVHRGVAAGDLDGDGRLDIVVAANDGSPRVLANRSEPVGGFLGLWLEGERSNRSAIGAVVTATVGSRSIVRQVHGAQSYLSVADFRLHFGLGAAEGVDRLDLRWPNGDTQVARDLDAGWYRWQEGEEPTAFVPGAWSEVE
jgi:hypothetical protein